MELVAGLLVVAVLGGPWVLAIVAMVRESRLRRRLGGLEETVGALRAELARAVGTAVTAAPAPESAAAAAPPATLPAAKALSPAPAPTRAAAPEAPPPAAAMPSPAAAALPRASPVAPPSGASPQDTLEEKIALVWGTRIGAL
ncbi:MAG TPA: hypothetical protein VLS93_16405, partial [Anaeromyxobacteraceae bacterium]|nr:hypothetical protein [Anaeromyxobacteraceae bacterium]